MNNIELEQKIKEIIAEENYFEMVIKATAFEKEYKTSDFYKITKKPLSEVIKESKIFYALQLKDLGKRIQNILDNLSLDNVNQLLDSISGVFGDENEEIQKSLEVIKDLNN